MKIDKASRTAQYMAFFRALETQRSNKDRLFSDRYAIHFLDRRLRLAVNAARISIFERLIHQMIQKKIPGALSSGIARTKYIDDLLQSTIAEGVNQVIILGAGFDTRASRLNFLRSIPVIEMDHPNTSAFKMETMKNRIGELPKNVRYCQIDFNHQRLNQMAKQYQFDFARTTTVIWEGVTNYLTAEAVQQAFSFTAQFPMGSYVIFTYVHQDILDHPDLFVGGEKLLNDLNAIEERWTFGLTPEKLQAYMDPFHFKVVEDLGAMDYRNKYLAARTEPGYEFYRVALVRKC